MKICVTYYDSVQLGEFKIRPKEKVCSLESTFSQFTQKSQEIILFSFKKTSREDQEKPQTAFLWFEKGSKNSEYLYFVKRFLIYFWEEKIIKNLTYQSRIKIQHSHIYFICVNILHVDQIKYQLKVTNLHFFIIAEKRPL